MAKKTIPAKSVSKSAAPVATATTTPVRNTTVPPKAVAQKVPALPTRDQIALKAYFISLSGTGGNQDENWFRAERELRGL